MTGVRDRMIELPRISLQQSQLISLADHQVGHASRNVC